MGLREPLGIGASQGRSGSGGLQQDRCQITRLATALAGFPATILR